MSDAIKKLLAAQAKKASATQPAAKPAIKVGVTAKPKPAIAVKPVPKVGIQLKPQTKSVVVPTPEPKTDVVELKSLAGIPMKVSKVDADSLKELNDISSPTAAEVELLGDRFEYTDQLTDVSPEEVTALKESFNILSQSFDNPEMVSQAIPIIMQRTRDNPALCKLLHPEHVGIMVRSLRESYGRTVVKKAKTAKAKKPKTTGLNLDLDSVMSQLDGLSL